MKTHSFDALSFVSGLVAAAVGVLFLLPAEFGDLVDAVTNMGSWLLPAIFLTIGVAVLAPVLLRRNGEDSDD